MAEDFEFDLEDKGNKTYAPVNDDRRVPIEDVSTVEKVDLDFQVH